MDRKPAREAPSLYVFYRSARLEARIECYDVRCFKKLKNLEGGLCTLMFVSKTRGGKHDATSAIPSDTVLIVGGDDREAGSLGELLTEEGLKATICPSLETLIASVTDGAGAALIAGRGADADERVFAVGSISRAAFVVRRSPCCL